MREEPEKSSSLRESSYRVMVLVVVIGCHMGLLMLMLRPVFFQRNTAPATRNNLLALKLRFFRPSPSYPALPVPRLTAPTVRSPEALPAGSSKSPMLRQATRDDAPPYGTSSTGSQNPDTGEESSFSDGGFHERLRSARHSYSIHGMPGSDTPFVPGIHLVDPMSQGIGAVMRATQRAFGIKKSHCIDVEVWRHLSPRELSARHVSPGDVDKVDEKYGCNEPPGLRF